MPNEERLLVVPDSISDRSVGHRIALLRQAAGLTQSSRGRGAGQTQSWVAHIETGRRRVLFQEAIELAELLRADLRLLDPRTAMTIRKACIEMRAPEHA